MAEPPNAEPGAPYEHPAPSGYLHQVGDIGVTADSIVTYRGTAPLAGSSWLVLDHSRVENKIPLWAIILAVIFFSLCFLGLLFLLIKEDKVAGYVEVRVQSGEFWHATHIPVVDPGHAPWILDQVGQIQALSHYGPR
ncbi:MAG: hypothetical protein AAF962_18570 [Actinomycetota bacterium]